METFAFLPVEGEKLFAATHRPEPGSGSSAGSSAGSSSEGAGVLVLHPFAEEKLWAARATTRLARALCERGLPVCRFDFRGHGDSDRAHHEMSLDTLRADAHAAAAAFRADCGVETLHLFGIRLGGTLALAFAAELGAASVCLVNPVPDGKAYLMRALRSALTMQMGIHGEVREDRETLLARMRETGLLNLDGYHLAAGCFDQIAGLDLVASPPDFAGPGLVLALVRAEGAAPDPDSRKVHEAALAAHPASRLASAVLPAVWSEQVRFSTGDPVLFDPVADWCGGGWWGEGP